MAMVKIATIIFLLLIGLNASARDGSMKKGEMLFRNGSYEQALVVLEEARRELPESARVLSTLGRTQFHLGNHIASRKSLEKSLVIQERPDWVTCWSNLYIAKLDLHESGYDAARERLDHIVDKQIFTPTCLAEVEKFRGLAVVKEYTEREATQVQKNDCCTIRYNEDSLTDSGLEPEMLWKTVQGYADTIKTVLHLNDNELPGVTIVLHPGNQLEEVWRSQEPIARYYPNEFHVTYENRGYIKHELVHYYTADKVREAENVPLLTEGIAEYVVANPWGIPLHGWVKNFRRLGEYVPLKILLDKKKFRKVNPIVAYEEAGSFVQFFIARYGLDLFFDLLEGRRSMEDVSGLNVAELEEKWLGEVEKYTFTDEEAELVRFRIDLGDYYHSAVSYGGGKLQSLGLRCEAVGKDVVVTHVKEEGLAKRSGFREGDVIMSVDGTRISSELIWHIGRALLYSGSKEGVVFEIKRSGQVEKIILPVDVEDGEGAIYEM